MHQCESLALNLLDHYREDVLLCFLVFWQEYQSRSILTFLGHGDTLQQDKLVRNLYHDTGSVASLVASLSSAMFHVFQHLQCIVYQIVTLSAVDVYYHSHAASIVLIVALIESLILNLKFTFRHIILTFTITLLNFAAKV